MIMFLGSPMESPDDDGSWPRLQNAHTSGMMTTTDRLLMSSNATERVFSSLLFLCRYYFHIRMIANSTPPVIPLTF